MLVSIIIPTYNRVNLLKKLIQSILNQTIQDFEIIIIDDNTPDHNDYSKRINEIQTLSNNIFYFKNNKNMGAPFSRNFGRTQAKGEVLCFVDDDDTWEKNKLERELFFLKEKNVDALGSWAKVRDSNEKVLYELKPMISSSPKSQILDECFIVSPSFMIKTKAFDRVHGYDEKLPSCQDWDLYTRLAYTQTSFYSIPEFLVNYYKHEGQSIGTSPRAKLGYYLYYKKHFFKFVLKLKLRHIARFFKLRWILRKQLRTF